MNGQRKTLSLSDSEFAEWLLHPFFNEMKKAPGAGAMKAAIQNLSMRAKFDGEKHDVHLRSAKVGGKIYFDIGDSDWSVVEVDASGWRMTDASPVRFRRTAGMAALPRPERGGSIAQLRDLVNLTDQGFVLFVSWILDGLHPARTPHPLLYLAGEQGSAKTTAAKIARSLVDPNEVPLRNLPLVTYLSRPTAPVLWRSTTLAASQTRSQTPYVKSPPAVASARGSFMPTPTRLSSVEAALLFSTVF